MHYSIPHCTTLQRTAPILYVQLLAKLRHSPLMPHHICHGDVVLIHHGDVVLTCHGDVVSTLAAELRPMLTNPDGVGIEIIGKTSIQYQSYWPVCGGNFRRSNRKSQD